jgi:hypothetical protein
LCALAVELLERDADRPGQVLVRELGCGEHLDELCLLLGEQALNVVVVDRGGHQASFRMSPNRAG